MTTKNLKATIKEEIKFNGLGLASVVSATVKTNFSGHHMLSAAFFARQSANIEETVKKDNLTDEVRDKHRAYVTGAIISSVASLEAAINEIFLSAIDGNKIFQNFDDKFPELLTELWPTVEKTASILHKYQIVLVAATKEKFNPGQTPYQEVDDLIKLRNALVHYKPEWDTNLKNHKKIEQRLKTRFPINPYSHINDAFFPKKCLGHGCAEWAVKSSIKFIQDFYERMGFKPKWDEKRLSKLKTD